MIKPLEKTDKEWVINLLKAPKIDIGLPDGMYVESMYLKNFSQVVEKGWCYKYLENNQPVGFIIAGNDGIKTFIYDLEVAPQHQRKGIGNKLLNHIIDMSRSKGYPLHLITDTYNYIATSLYIKNQPETLFATNYIRFTD